MTIPKPLLAESAARNNAEWCAAVSRAHGLAGEFTAQAWASSSRTPPYYPDAVTLVPGADQEALTARIDTTAPGASVKDSFADLDLGTAGFRVLFEAQWIHRPATAQAVSVAGPGWHVVRDPAVLRAWALAWDDGGGHADVFRPGLLDDPAVHVLAGLSPDGRVTAGAVAGRGDRVVGVSNVFAEEGGPDAAWPFVLEALHRVFPGLPVVGYESGADLTAALHHGFEPVGPLRVWLHDGTGAEPPASA